MLISDSHLGFEPFAKIRSKINSLKSKKVEKLIPVTFSRAEAEVTEKKFFRHKRKFLLNLDFNFLTKKKL